MVKISGAQGAGAASGYFQKEYSNGGESYYTEGDREEVRGEYFGELAMEMGLTGEVTPEDFHRLIEGQDPTTGEQLIRHVPTKTYLDKFGKEIKTSSHRAGWDIVFSCPKSISLAAGPGGDKRIPELQREAVVETLAEMEKYLAGKDGHSGHHTGKMVAAIFQHDCARPDRETGYAAPDLHDHVFVMNMTKDETGKFRAVEIDSLYRVRDFATHLHWAKLVEKMEGIGYEFERSPRTGAPEIKGFSQEYLAENSKRRGEVLRNEVRLKQEAAEAGFTVEGSSLRGKAARMERRSKTFDRTEMQIRHIAVERDFGFQAVTAVRQAQERGPVIRTPEETEKRAREAVTFAEEHVYEREAVAARTEIEKQALRRSWGQTTYEAIKAEIEKRIDAGELVEIDRGRGPEMTSREMIELERDNLQRMQEGQGRNRPPVKASVVDFRIREAAKTTSGVRLNESQHKALREILTSEDQVTGLQGYAGAGKTTTLTTLRGALEERGYDVYGLAPLTRAANLLTESGIKTTTLQQFIQSSPVRSHAPRYYILDETSLADTRSMNAFFQRLAPSDQVLLVGDKAQHQAISAGAPFEQFQDAGMRTAVLDEIVRQKEPGLKKAVELLSKGQAREAVELLISQDRVTEIENPQDRMRAIAQDYCARPGALVICLRNAERAEQNRMIHEALQDAGKVSPLDHETTVYISRDITGAERKFAGAYQVGDVIRYSRGSKEHDIRAKEYWDVVKVDQENNQLVVLSQDGRRATYDPRRLKGVSVYREDTRQFAEGDRIQFRAPLAEQRIGTNEIGTIEKLGRGEVTIKLDGEKERMVKVDLQEFKHFDHGYAVTSISSQGLGSYRGILNANAHESALLLNERTAYVANSRAIHDMQIYTNSKEDLPRALDRRSDKEIALDAVRTTEERREALEQTQAKEEPKKIEQTKDRGHGYGFSY
jgi:conjugative relaxase-like TrwC/TraI family protein